MATQNVSVDDVICEMTAKMHTFAKLAASGNYSAEDISDEIRHLKNECESKLNQLAAMMKNPAAVEAYLHSQQRRSPRKNARVIETEDSVEVVDNDLRPFTSTLPSDLLEWDMRGDLFT